MKYTRLYFNGAKAVGILEIIDGLLLLVNKGFINWFNLLVSIVELYWIPVCAVTAFVFYRKKLSMISPVSYLFYHLAGLAVVTLTSSFQGSGATVPMWAGIVGTVFGVYYLIINDIMKTPVSQNETP